MMNKKLTLLLLIASFQLFSQENTFYSMNQLQKVPVYPGCKGDNEQLKKCFNKNIQRHFVRNSNPNLIAKVKKPARAFILFEISKEGKATNIKIKTTQKILINEFERIIKLLPNFEPGKIENKPVLVKYTFPFRIEGFKKN